MIEIPAWMVALSALILLLLILRDGVGVDIRIFSLLCGLQVIEYLVFQFVDLSIETKQFISRLGVISANVVLSVIIGGNAHNGK